MCWLLKTQLIFLRRGESEGSVCSSPKYIFSKNFGVEGCKSHLCHSLKLIFPKAAYKLYELFMSAGVRSHALLNVCVFAGASHAAVEPGMCVFLNYAEKPQKP